MPKFPQKKQLDKLYSRGMSMSQIAAVLNCSIHKVVYWMNKYNISRRNRSDAAYIKQNPNGDPFSIKHNLSSENRFLFDLALGIYWGEGNKLSKNSIRVTNTDYNMILIFREFLLNICQINPTKIKYSIVAFNDSNLLDVETYWSKRLKTQIGNFGKIVQIPTQGKGTYKKKSKFGVCTITVSNIKLKSWLMNELAKIKIADIV